MSTENTVDYTEVIETPVTDTATVRKLLGQTLDKEYTIQVTYNSLADNSAIPADSEFTHQEKIDILNARRKATARAASTAALAESLGISKPKLLETNEGRIATMAKVYRAMGLSETEAVALAEAALAGVGK
jgi:DNA-binding phage protein